MLVMLTSGEYSDFGVHGLHDVPKEALVEWEAACAAVTNYDSREQPARQVHYKKHGEWECRTYRNVPCEWCMGLGLLKKSAHKATVALYDVAKACPPVDCTEVYLNAWSE